MAMRMRMPLVSKDEMILIVVALAAGALGFVIMANLPTITEFVAARIQAWAENNFGYVYR